MQKETYIWASQIKTRPGLLVLAPNGICFEISDFMIWRGK
jgi:hypothetical protein